MDHTRGRQICNVGYAFSGAVRAILIHRQWDAQTRTAETIAPDAADEAQAGLGLHVGAVRRQRGTGNASHQLRRQSRQLG